MEERVRLLGEAAPEAIFVAEESGRLVGFVEALPYEKLGFVREGIARHSLLVDGACVDAYDMARLLS